MTRLVLLLLLVGGMFLGMLVSMALGATCREAPTSEKAWRWREVDGRKCWYPGRRRLSREALRWPTATQASASERDEEEVLLHSYWPPLPKALRAAIAACERYDMDVDEYDERSVVCKEKTR